MADPGDDTKAEPETTLFEADAILCSICLDAIVDDVERSRAKLYCGHEFHLDCIGSAFNMKGAMQCPNCRKVEKGRWLYASGCSTRSISEISMEDWTLHEDHYGLGYPDIPLNIHWCPFSGLARVHSAFEPLESSSLGYHNLHGHHRAISSIPHSYIAYLRPVPSASSNVIETVDDPNFSYQWNGVSNPHIYPVADQSPVTHRSTRGDFGAMSRSGPYMHPFLYDHGNRSLEILQPIHHPPQPNNPLGVPSTIIPNMTRFHGHRTLPPPPVPTNSVSNGNGGFFIFPSQGSTVPTTRETENPFPGVSSDQSSDWISFHNAGGTHRIWS